MLIGEERRGTEGNGKDRSGRDWIGSEWNGKERKGKVLLRRCKMEDEYMRWDWNVELKDSETEWFKPTDGLYQVTITSILGKRTHPEFGDRIELLVDVIDLLSENTKPKTFNWSVSISEYKASLYGQLQQLRQQVVDLVGVTFTLYVKGEGAKKRYEIKQKK